MKILKWLLLSRKLEELSILMGRKGNYGGITFQHSDGKGGWDGKVDLGIRKKVIKVGYEEEQLTFLGMIDNLLEKLRKL